MLVCDAMLLIVDDDPGFLHLASVRLSGAGRDVLLAKDAPQARDLLRMLGTEIGIALIDLRLPSGEDGLALIEELRSNRPSVAVIAITALADNATMEAAREGGAVEVLRKPITSEWETAIQRARNRQ